MAETVCGPADELGDRRRRRPRRARRPEPRPPRRKAAASRASRCSTPSANTPRRCSPNEARSTSSPAARPRHAEAGGGGAPNLPASEQRTVARPARAGARQPAGGARMGDGPPRSRARRPAGIRPLAVLAAARVPQRGAHPLDAMAAQRWTWTPSARPLCRGARWHRLLAGRPPGQQIRWYKSSSIWRDLGRQGRDRECACTTTPTRTPSDDGHHRGDPWPRTHRPSAGRGKLEEALALYREIGDTAGEGNVLWALGSYHYFTAATIPPAEDWYREALELHRAAGDRTMEAWSLHMLALVGIGNGEGTRAGEHAREALRPFLRRRRCRRDHLVLDDLASIAVSASDFAPRRPPVGAARHCRPRAATTLAATSRRRTCNSRPRRPGPVLSPRNSTASAEGAAMGLDEVVAYALEDPAA